MSRVIFHVTKPTDLWLGLQSRKNLGRVDLQLDNILPPNMDRTSIHPKIKKKRCFFLLYGGNTRVRTDSWDCPKTDAFSNIFPPVLLKTLPRSSHCWQRHTNRHRAGGGERLRHVRLYNPLDCSMPGRVECL